MIKKIDILRDKIDKIDQKLLKLLSERLLLVSAVGELKSRFGLFVYSPDREEKMISCRKKEAEKLGISSDFIEDILRRIICESYVHEHSKGFKKLCPNLRSVVIIGGKGHVGQFFFKMLILSGYQVLILDKNDWANANEMLVNAGMVLISVPISSVVDVVDKLPKLSSDCIVVDLSFIKEDSLRIILAAHKGPVLGLCPMFNPDRDNMIKQVVIYCDGRYPESYQWLLKQLKLWGAKLYSANFVEHDQWMSVIQGMCHFITFATGYHLLKENVDLDKMISFASPVFRLKLIMIGRLFSQDPQLYADIIMMSKHNIVLIKRYYRNLAKLLILIEKNNKSEFIYQFNKIKNWFSTIYTDSFLKESNKIFCQMDIGKD